MFLTDFDRAVISAWRAVVARGEVGGVGNVRDELKRRGIADKSAGCDGLRRRLAWMERVNLIVSQPAELENK